MLEAAPRTLFVLDEAYAEFSGVTVLPWIRRYPNLIVVRTFSKGAGLAGLRLGCMFACAEVTSLLARTREPFSVNSAAIVAAEATLRDYRAVTRYAKEIKAAREMLASALIRFGVKIFPSAANFILADFGVSRAAQFFADWPGVAFCCAIALLTSAAQASCELRSAPARKCAA